MNLADISEEKKKLLIRELKKIGADPDRGRCIYDWIYKSVLDKKDLILYNELDSPAAIAHELGHFLEQQENFKGKVQSFSGNMATRIAGFAAGLFGLFGTVGEIIGFLTSFSTHFPELYTEFYASYYGYYIIKDRIGASKADLHKVKEFYKLAYATYVNHALTVSARASFYKLIGLGLGKH